MRRALVAVAVAAFLAVPVSLLGMTTSGAAGFDSASAEAQLAREVNADRAANGRGPLAVSPILSDIARGAPHSTCGEVLHGRSQDMVERGYFSHQAPPCGAIVWPVLRARGINFSLAAENIGWNNVSPPAASADQVNVQFMSSPEHRANILGNFNQVGIGAFAAPGNWGYNGRAGVIVYTEIFTLGPLPARSALPPVSTPTVRVPSPVAPPPVAPPPGSRPVAAAPSVALPPPTRPLNQLIVTSRNGCVQAIDLARDGGLWCSWDGGADSAWTPWVSPGKVPVVPPGAPSTVPGRPPANPWALLWSVLSRTPVLAD